MSSKASEHPSLTLTGKVCPWLFRDIEAHLESVEAGDAVTLIAAAGGQAAAVSEAVQKDGHAVVGVRRRDGNVELTVRKGRPDSPHCGGKCCPRGDCP